MLRIDNILVDESVADVAFMCDLAACKGACCTMPGSRGAPLLDSEIDEIQRWYPKITHLLSPQHVAVAERDGPYSGVPGDYVTTCVNERACVFVVTEGGIATCAFERAFHQGLTPWRKPLSCHLFPIRIRRRVPEFLEYESIRECEPALRYGTEQGIPLDRFLHDSLMRAYNSAWVDRLHQACSRHRMSHQRSPRQ